MSRYGFPDQNGGDVVVGWDPPMATYFLQAEFAGPDDEPAIWCGLSPCEISTVADLDLIVRRALGVVIPDSIQHHLKRDQIRDPGRFAASHSFDLER